MAPVFFEKKIAAADFRELLCANGTKCALNEYGFDVGSNPTDSGSFFFPALSLFCGVRPAQEQRCFEVGNTDISTPILKMMPIMEKDWIPSTVVIRLSCGRYFSVIVKIKDSRLNLHSLRLSIWERMRWSFSACSSHISPSTAASTCSSAAFMRFVWKPETSVIFSAGEIREIPAVT